MPSRPALRVLLCLPLVAAAALPVHAHPGSHHALTFAELAAHLATGWHLAVLAAAAGVTFVGLAGIRVARARASRAGARWRDEA